MCVCPEMLFSLKTLSGGRQDVLVWERSVSQNRDHVYDLSAERDRDDDDGGELWAAAALNNPDFLPAGQLPRVWLQKCWEGSWF